MAGSTGLVVPLMRTLANSKEMSIRASMFIGKKANRFNTI